jgi:hypothetical protein
MVWALKHQTESLTIGPPAYADLCALYEDFRSETSDLTRHLRGLTLLLTPAGMKPFTFPIQVHAKQPVTLTLRARGNEADSNELRVRIDWDGQWPDDEAARKQHLKVDAV